VTDASTRAGSAGRRRPAILLLILAVLVFLPTLRYGFVFDDNVFVEENAYIHDWGSIGEALAVWHQGPLNYRPVRYVSLALDWNLSGGRPWLFHLTNILLHAVCALLLARVVLAFGFADPVAWGTAFLFALHPIHASTVAYVSARKDLLVTAFYLATLLAFLSYRRHGGILRATAVVLAALLAAFSKETAVTLPLILLLSDLWLTPRRKGESGRHALARVLAERRWFYGGAMVLAVVYGIYKLAVWPATKVPSDQWLDMWTHLGTAFHVWARALGTMLLPVYTIADYQGMFRVGQGWDALSAVGLLATALLVAAAWASRRRVPAVTLGIAFLLVSWIPTSGLLPIAEVFAEHYLYLPSLGLCLALGGLAAAGARRAWNPGEAPGALRWTVVAALIVLGGWTLVLENAWASPQRVWETTLRHNSASPRACSSLALIYQEQGRTTEARRLARQAARMAPRFERVQANYAGILYEQGDFDGAIAATDASLADLPDSYRLELVRAKALLARGDLDESIRAYRKVADLSPTPEHLGLLGETLSVGGHWDEAREVLEQAVDAKPDYSQAWTNLGLVTFQLGDTLVAEQHLRRAIRIAPDDPDPHNNLAVLLYHTGRFEEAQREANESIRLGRPLHPEFEQALQKALDAKRED
jgi:Flp pilus assembly protein TadD